MHSYFISCTQFFIHVQIHTQNWKASVHQAGSIQTLRYQSGQMYFSTWNSSTKQILCSCEGCMFRFHKSSVISDILRKTALRQNERLWWPCRLQCLSKVMTTQQWIIVNDYHYCHTKGLSVHLYHRLCATDTFSLFLYLFMLATACSLILQCLLAVSHHIRIIYSTV